MNLKDAYRGPTKTLLKYSQKRLDEQVESLKSRFDPSEYSLEAAAQTFHILQDQLVEDLPLFLAYATKIIDVLVQKIAIIQSEFWRTLEIGFAEVLAKMNIATTSVLQRVERTENNPEVEERIRAITLMNSWWPGEIGSRSESLVRVKPTKRGEDLIDFG